MSDSVRSTTTAVLHRGHRYAPDAPHQPRIQSEWLAGVMVDSEMRSLEGTGSGMSAEARRTWSSSALPCSMVYDGSPLNAAAGAMMRRHTWKEYGVNIQVQRTWRNHVVATRIPWRRWKGRRCESVGDADGNLGRPRGRRSWSLRPRMPPFGKTEGHQARYVRWQPPQPRPLLGEAGQLRDDRH